MAKQTLGQGDSNVVVRNQVVYGALPQDVIDRMGDTTLALQTTEQNVLPAINELKSNLTDSGWQTIATYYEYRKLNGVVYVRKKDTTQVSITATFTTIFTLPEGFRPTNSNGSFVYSVPAMAQAQGIQIKVLDTGAVQAAAQFGSNTPVMYQWAISFPLG